MVLMVERNRGGHLIRRFAERGNEPDPCDVNIASLKERIQELEPRQEKTRSKRAWETLNGENPFSYVCDRENHRGGVGKETLCRPGLQVEITECVKPAPKYDSDGDELVYEDEEVCLPDVGDTNLDATSTRDEWGKLEDEFFFKWRRMMQGHRITISYLSDIYWVPVLGYLTLRFPRNKFTLGYPAKKNSDGGSRERKTARCGGGGGVAVEEEVRWRRRIVEEEDCRGGGAVEEEDGGGGGVVVVGCDKEK
ncbi:hypothetical protein Tco_0382460 [Tanacetum coccineum]